MIRLRLYIFGRKPTEVMLSLSPLLVLPVSSPLMWKWPELVVRASTVGKVKWKSLNASATHPR